VGDWRCNSSGLPGDHREFFEHANDACAVFTPDGIILAVNGGAERLLGWSRAELIG
jgi:PAS domain S-box-containing protein